MKRVAMVGMGLLVCLLSAGCLTWDLKPLVTTPDQSAFKPLRAGGRIAITEFTGFHKAQSSGGQFCLIVSCLPVGVAAGKKTMSKDTFRAGDPAAKIPPADYVEGLNRECLQAIEKALTAGNIFTYVPMAAVKGAWPKNDAEKAAIQKLIKNNGLSGAITVDMTYILLVGAKKPVGLATRWAVLDADGNHQLTVQTCVATAQGTEMFPGTKDPQYHATFIDLARKSAEDFLLMIRGAHPIHSRPMSAQP